jgi:dihydrofolate synthase/folylpolyglutamate synthase
VIASGAALGPILEALYARVPMGMRLGLEAMESASARFDHPEASFAAVHVAGTNGKGSVSAMVESIARAAGLRTGLYTSPHLCRFAERIRIDGEPIDDATLGALVARALADEATLSFFEAATLAAFLAFREARVDLAVVEVGLGGRLDATNILPRPRAAAITRIALDHTARLGPTLVDIAREKAGIAKAGLELVTGPMPPEVFAAIEEVAHAKGATVTPAPELAQASGRVLQIGLAGAHQRENARVAVALAERLALPAVAIARGLADARWPGRLERIGPYLLDAAHNPDGVASLVRHVATLGVPPERTCLVFGALAEKEWAPMLDALAPMAEARVYVAPSALTSASRPAVNPSAMAARVPGLVASSVGEALDRAGQDAGKDKGKCDLIVVAGSILLIGAVRAKLLSLPCDPGVAL